ncbi:hypothetical protein DH2020_045581 [Rehmannia glutinosa]|uniref:Protein kinase domain-containing protein n=1 Tax=Rehmannia glutinosa TaxID=99300 RepID=A0ABR0UDT2_REHGL
MSLILHFFLYTSFFTQLATPLPNHQCTTTNCGSFEIPFPFYLNNATSTCNPTLSDAFRLSCINSSTLFLNISSQTYRVLHFFPDAVLVDFPNFPNTSSVCRQYNDLLKSFSFSGNEYFGISTDNVLDLYDCEDSSLCKPDCERTSVMPGCDGQAAGGRYPSCCYPLSDHSVWRPGESSLSVFSRFGCRGFSSWVVLPGSTSGKRGIKLEWGVPRNTTNCAANADVVNATSVTSGIRCRCRDGFVGDGFPVGVGCLKSCFKDGKEVRGNDCHRNNHGRKKAIILAGVLTSALIVVSLTALCLLKRPNRSSEKFVSNGQAHCQSSISSQKACKSRLFTYHELEEATKGFREDQKIVDGATSTTTMYAGVLIGGSHVAVQRVRCESERELIRFLFRVEALSAVSHRNMARIIGWSIDSGFTPLLVYEYPENGTFKEHLVRGRDNNQEMMIPLDWYTRLNIASETACILAFLQHEVSPPIFHHDLQSGYVFLDMDFSVKLAGFELQISDKFEGHSHCRKNDVYSFGVILLEIITGNTMVNVSTVALQKIKNGKLEEIVDPSLYYHEQLPFRREQIEIIADLATRCILFGADGKLGMADVAKELVHITKDSVDHGSSRRGPALEETFSNSSLLQMISMSPDSIYVPGSHHQ